MQYWGSWVDYAGNASSYPLQSGNSSYFGQAIAASPLTDFEGRVGKKVSVAHYGTQWVSSGVNQGFNTRIKSGLDNVWNSGRIPCIDWGNWDLANHANDRALAFDHIINNDFMPDGVTRIDAFLTSWAQQAAAWRHPFFIRLWHEHNLPSNASQFPWTIAAINNWHGLGVSWTNTVLQFQQAWQHIVSIFHAQGASNVTWMWCPNIRALSTSTSLYAYPGSAYVDWIGIDGYSFDSTDNLVDQWRGNGGGNGIADTYAEVNALDPTKPMCIGETEVTKAHAGALDPTGKATTLKTFFDDELNTRCPLIQMILWFHVWYNDTLTTAWVSDFNNSTGLSATSPAWIAYMNGIGQSMFAEGGGFDMPPDLTPIAPLNLATQSTPWAYVMQATKGQISRWMLDEPAGATTALDTSGNAHNSTTVGSGVTFGAGNMLPSLPAKTAPSFNGVAASSYIEFPDSNAYSPAVNSSIGIITSVLTPAASPGGWIIAKVNAGNSEWGIKQNPSGTYEANVFDLTGATLLNASAHNVAGGYVANQPVFLGLALDTALAANSTRGFWYIGPPSGTLAQFTTVDTAGTYGNGTSTVRIGGRTDLNLTSGAGTRIGPTLAVSPRPNSQSMRDIYTAWSVGYVAPPPPSSTYGVGTYGVATYGGSTVVVTGTAGYDIDVYDTAVYDAVAATGTGATGAFVVGPVRFVGTGGPSATPGITTCVIGPVRFVGNGAAVIVSPPPPPEIGQPVPIVEVAFTSLPFQPPVWVNISAYVQDFSFTRGVNRELGVAQAGTLQLTLSNRDRRFDPTYTPSPYYPFVLPGRKIRIRALSNGAIYPRYTGYIESWGQEWQGWQDATVTVTAADAFKPLNLAQLNTTYPVQSSDARINAILNDVNWTVGGPQFTLNSPTLGILGSTTVLGPTGDRSIGTGQTVIQASTLTNVSALSHMQAVAASEFGMLFASADGTIVYIGRNRAITAQQSFATFGENELPYVDVTMSYDDTDIANDVRITGASGVAQVAGDPTSVGEYFLRTLAYTSLLNSDAASLALANLLLARHKQPALQITSLTLDGTANPTLLYPQMFGRELTDQVTVIRRPPAGGSAIVQLSSIQQITESYSATDGGVWADVWRLQPVDTTAYWVLNDPVRSILGTSTVLFF